MQTRFDDEQSPWNSNTDRSNGVFDRAGSCATISSDEETPQNEKQSAQTSSEWTPFATNFSLEIVEAKGLPQAENGGIFPDTYASASLLYADLWSMEQLPVDHAAGDEQLDNSGDMGSVRDVQSLPFKIPPHVRTDPHARSVNPKWQSKFTLTQTRPSFIVLDGPDYTKKLFSSQCDVPLQGQNVLLLITIHEQQRFGGHRRMGSAVLELKPGPPLDDWFTLHKRNGFPLTNSTGPGSAAVRLRIAYPGYVSDSISPFKLRSRRMDDHSLDVSTSDWSFAQAGRTSTTMLTPYRMPEAPLTDATMNCDDISYISPPQPGANESSSALFPTSPEAVKKVNPNDASYDASFLERVARQMFHASHSKKKNSSSHVRQPETPASAVGKPVQRQSDCQKECGRGLELAILSSSNLPRRLADGQSPSAYACVSLILSSASEKGLPQLSHDVRRGSSKIVRSNEKHHIRLIPQCQTQALPECADPEWNAQSFLTEAMTVKEGMNLGSRPLDPPGGNKADEVYLVLVSVYDQFEFGSDRLLGSCIFPILPGQRLLQTLTLQGCNRLEENSSASQKATIRIRAYLNIPSVSQYGCIGVHQTLAIPWPLANHHKPRLKRSVPSTTSSTAQTLPSVLHSDIFPLMTSRSYLDVSDSDSEDDRSHASSCPTSAPLRSSQRGRCPYNSVVLRESIQDAEERESIQDAEEDPDVSSAQRVRRGSVSGLANKFEFDAVDMPAPPESPFPRPPPCPTALSPSTNSRSSTDSSRSARLCKTAPGSRKGSQPASGQPSGKVLQRGPCSFSTSSGSVEARQAHAQHTPTTFQHTPTTSQSPSSPELRKNASYTELEKAFMARVAARQQKDQNNLPHNGKDAGGDRTDTLLQPPLAPLSPHQSNNNHWKPTAHN